MFHNLSSRILQIGNALQIHILAYFAVIFPLHYTLITLNEGGTVIIY